MSGGASAEREVSLRSGAAVAGALKKLGHRVDLVDPAIPEWALPAGTDVVFLALHGTFGEDGTVQEILDRQGALYTGSGAQASRVAFDKVLAKEACMRAGVPTARFFKVSGVCSVLPPGFHVPLVAKPCRQGSSVGLQFIEQEEDLGRALEESLRHDSEALVEEKVVGRETTVGILDGQALPVVEVRPKRGPLDYKNKYTPGATDYFCPADFGPDATKRIQDAALGAYRAVGCRDYARVDVMVAADGAPVVLEVNTLPGMTETSLLPKAAAAAGLDYAALCQRMVELAMRRGGRHVV